MRLFFAVTLPQEAQDAAQQAQARLRASAGERGIAWEAPRKFHYTLKYLGETSDAEKALAVEAGRVVAAQTAPFLLTLAGVGAFPQQRRPQVLWIGASEGVPHLTRLAESLERALMARGFAPETRRYHPHLTLARMRGPEGEEAIAKTLAAEAAELKKVDKFGVIAVSDFVLMRSELHPSGAIYSVLETFPLTAL